MDDHDDDFGARPYCPSVESRPQGPSEARYQMLKYTFSIPHATQENVQCEAIGLYRSGVASNTTEFLSDLVNLIDISKVCIIAGDFNICQQKNANNGNSYLGYLGLYGEKGAFLTQKITFFSENRPPIFFGAE